MCGVLYWVRNNLRTEVLTSIYYALCYPHLIYCVSVWACMWLSYEKKKLTIAQNKIFKYIFHMGKYDSTQFILSTYKVFNFQTIHKYFLLLTIYMNIRNCQRIQPFRPIDTSHNIRSNKVNLICLQFRTTLFKNSMLCPGPQLWNSLTYRNQDSN